jgi:hypothetical protein
MNKQFLLLALATVSLNLGIAGLSFAKPLPTNFDNPQLISKAKKPSINVSKISIGALKLGMTTVDVITILGKPLSIESFFGDCLGDIVTKVTYPGLDISFDSGGIRDISATNKKYQTKEGIRVGDAINKARKVYSKFQLTEDLPESSYAYFTNNSDGGLVFTTDPNGIITKINLSARSC